MKTTTATFVKAQGFQGYYVITLPSGAQYVEHDHFAFARLGIPAAEGGR